MRKTAIAGAIAAAMLVAAPALAVPSKATGEAPAAAEDPVEELRRLVETVRGEIFKPGEIVAGWNDGKGADPDSELRKAGADKFYYLISEGESRQVAVLTDRRVDDLAPAGWKPVDSYGSPVAYAENPFVQFSPLDDHHLVGMRASGYRENGIDCVKAVTHAVLYQKPGAPAPAEDDVPPLMMFRLIMLAAEGQVTCSRYDSEPKGGWRVRHLLPDGRALPSDPAPTMLSIVPAAPVETLVRAGGS